MLYLTMFVHVQQHLGHEMDYVLKDNSSIF
jgi:hypothetical protein